jgi:hypothetical protein
MPNKKIAVGQPIEARCTKCRANTEHVIVTVEEDAPFKVQCGKCERQHKYRPPSVPKKPAVRKKADPKVAERKEWETLRPGMNSAAARDYSMTDAYKVKALINHPVFGLGLVQRIAGSRKVEVLFEDGKKTMRCG